VCAAGCARPRRHERSDALLEVRGLGKTFQERRGWPVPKTVAVRAIDSVSFDVARGEALGIVGESGCGKSTVARACLRLVAPDAGSVRFDGVDVTAASSSALRVLRRRMQIVFQDPASALDPRQRIADAIGEPIRVHGIARGSAVEAAVVRLLDEVGLPAAAARRYPHEFSGGQRQRIGIARALALGPDLVFADEPVSALDVSVQAQILVLLDQLRARRHLAFVFISHDLGVVRHFCQRVAVMYLGRLVEEGPVPQIFEEPLHPVHAAAQGVVADSRSRARRRAATAGGRAAVAGEPAVGLPFPSALPARDGALQLGGAAARRGRAGASRRVSPLSGGGADGRRLIEHASLSTTSAGRAPSRRRTRG
jgi:peptide/nickel transport system ATP-binding protein